MLYTIVTIPLLVLYFQTKCVATNNLQIDGRYVLKPQRLPEDLNFMPSLANGHLGFTVFGDAIYMNGVYNGFKGDSRRARLPNWLNITANILDKQTKAYLQPNQVNYEMNLYEGFYGWTQVYEKLNLTLQQRIYAHRYFNRALIYELLVERNSTRDEITLELQQNPGSKTHAFNIIPQKSPLNGTQLLKAITTTKEDLFFQHNLTSLYVAFNDNFPENKKILILNSNQQTLYYRFVLTADLDKAVTLKEMQAVLSLATDDLLKKHSKEWQQFWRNFAINIEGDAELAHITNAGIFYMASSLPSLNSYQPNNPYFGLSPTGLGRGQLDSDYEGHNFWDTEIWMLPVVSQMQPEWSKELFKYRLEHLPGALYNANITGYKEARFPWESAFTGTEVTNPCCPEVATQEIHISADIAVALQQFYATTYKRDWLCNTAWPLLREIATFLQSRVAWQNETQQYHIKNVMGPDEDHENVNDNVFTNVVFKQAFEFARFTHLSCDPQAKEDSKTWLNIANNMFILYDNISDYHPEYLGYKPGEIVKQADAILLGYPLQFPMRKTTHLNDLATYENVTRVSGPAMTWSMFAINYLDVGLTDKAQIYFEKAYKSYIRPEFKVWSETPIGIKGSANFLTGIGGFLQNFINGYAGISFQLENNVAKMLIKHTYLPQNITHLTIKGLKFADSFFILNIKSSGENSLKLWQMGEQCLEIIVDTKDPIRLYEGFYIQFETGLITIKTITKNDQL